ncbi:MAG: DHHA1 domain-containing protein [Planctomycetales bacterium]|nr:DHHA1 domain-containing protein [Planctomycetales bacterium]
MSPWPPPPPPSPDEEAALAAEIAVDPLCARVLRARGIPDAAAARSFLSPSLDHLPDPQALPGLTGAVARLRRAVESGERILVYGDYDADGTAGAALLLGVLRALGAEAEARVPDRQAHGYGLNDALCAEAAARGARVVVTVDVGGGDPSAVARVAALGLDVVVTDHHECRGGPPPEAVAFVNPRGSAAEGLCGAGVALALGMALAAEAPRARRAATAPALREALELAAVATIADVAPLRGPNRALVALGLRLLERPENPGLAALRGTARLPEGAPDAGTVAFRLVPRVNAAGRVDDPALALALLTTRDRSEAAALARRCETANRRRQAIERRVEAEARREAGRAPDAPAWVLAGDGWHPGVVGIVAGRLCAEGARPTAVIALEGDLGRGSARSVPGIPLGPALAALSDLLVAFGGHARAAGFTIRRSNVGPFRERFCSGVRSSGPGAPAGPHPDAAAEPGELTPAAAADLRRLAPFGEGNPPPILALSRVTRAGEVLARGGRRGAEISRVHLRSDGRVFAAEAGPGALAVLAAGTGPLDCLVRPRPRGSPEWEVLAAVPAPADARAS